MVINVIFASDSGCITFASGLEFESFLSEHELVHPIVKAIKIIAKNSTSLIPEILSGNRITDLSKIDLSNILYLDSLP